MANTFETEIRNSFKHYSSSYLNKYIRLIVNKQSSYGVKSDCDALVDFKDYSNLALELKQQLRREGFKYSRVEENQYEGLLDFKNIGRASYILICYRKWQLTEKELLAIDPKKRTAAQRRRAYAFEIDDFISIVKSQSEKNVKSIPISIVEEKGIKLTPISIEKPTVSNPKAKVSGWDITPLIRKK